MKLIHGTVVETVEELKTFLANLPDDLPLKDAEGGALCMSIYEDAEGFLFGMTE